MNQISDFIILYMGPRDKREKFFSHKYELEDSSEDQDPATLESPLLDPEDQESLGAG